MVVLVCLLHARGTYLGSELKCICKILADLTSGFPSSYGVFQEYYTNNDFAGSSNIAVVGTCAMVPHICKPFSFCICL